VVSCFAGVTVVAGGSGVAVVAGGFCVVVVIWRTYSVLVFRFLAVVRVEVVMVVFEFGVAGVWFL
jgi:hypothetical protein